MDIQAYIDSGILHDYAMDMLPDVARTDVERMCSLYPEINAELQSIRHAMENFATRTSVAPGAGLQESIWSTLDNINKERAADPDDLPVLNKYSDYHKWKQIVGSYMPQQIAQGIQVIPLRRKDDVAQMLIVSTVDVAEETHENEKECFLVLEGECECFVGKEVYRLGPGGFIDIPLHEPHNVKILSPHVVAVLQHTPL